MRMSAGVEWGLHCCLALAWIGEGEVVSTARLAEKFGLAPAYLNKALQALVRGGILASLPGSKGEKQQARKPAEITLLEIVDAIEGPEAAFRCTEIRRQGTGASPAEECTRPCAITTAMRRAESAWRKALADQTLEALMSEAPRTAAERAVRWYASVLDSQRVPAG